TSRYQLASPSFRTTSSTHCCTAVCSATSGSFGLRTNAWYAKSLSLIPSPSHQRHQFHTTHPRVVLQRHRFVQRLRLAVVDQDEKPVPLERFACFLELVLPVDFPPAAQLHAVQRPLGVAGGDQALVDRLPLALPLVV